MNCDCPSCECEVTAENDVEKDGKHFCCDACADGHSDGSACCSEGCSCAESQ